MCNRRVHWRLGPWEARERRGEDNDTKRERRRRRRGKKEEKRRLQLACRERQKKGEPHAPTQRRPTSKCQRTGAPNSASKQEKGNHPRTQPKGQRMQRIEEERVSGHILARPFRHQTMVEKSLDGETKQLKLDCSGVQFTGKRGGQGDQTSKTTAHLLELTKKRRFTTGHC